MASTTSSSSEGSGNTTDSSPGSLVDDSDYCCPLASSTVFSSSPPVCTPPATDQGLQEQELALHREEKECAVKSPTPTTSGLSKTCSASHSDPSDTDSQDACNPRNDSNSTCFEEEALDMGVRTRPKYYSLQSRSSQVEFAKHLESLLLAVLDDRRALAKSPSAIQETSGSQSSSSISPLQMSSPAAFAPRFIYVNVDEYSDNLQGSESTSEGSIASRNSPRHVADVEVCHPSKLLPSDFRTPLSTAAICVPSAPKKAQHHVYASENSPLTAEGPTKRSGDEIVRQESPTTNYMRTKHSMELGANDKMDCADNTPPQADGRTLEGPQKKKQKLSPFGSSSSRNVGRRSLASRLLANEPASLRRAASLRSETSVADMLNESAPFPMPISSSTEADATLDCALGLTILRHSDATSALVLSGDIETIAQTEPCSPSSRSRTASNSSVGSSLPLVAPPPFEEIPRAPLTPTEIAESHIASLVKKDWDERLADGLSIPSTLPTSDDALCEGSTLKQEEPEVKLSRSASQSDDENMASKLGVSETFRLKIVQWMLDVVPPISRSKPKLCSHLRKQLLECHDTRWHAAHLFTRYFLRFGTSPGSSPQIEAARHSSDDDDDIGSDSKRLLTGKEALTWDLAVACMALTVKFHRDVLPPLYPVTAEEFLLISPHTMEYDDLESAQRILLSALSFCIGSNTPGAYMDELWEALPSLRALVESRGNWRVTKVETWELLSDALLDAAYLNYPVHVLTGCALILGMVESLILTMKAEVAESLKLHATGRAPRTKRREAECTCVKLRKKAHKATRYVEQDMRELLNAPEELWKNCMSWLETIAEI